MIAVWLNVAAIVASIVIIVASVFQARRGERVSPWEVVFAWALLAVDFVAEALRALARVL